MESIRRFLRFFSFHVSNRIKVLVDCNHCNWSDFFRLQFSFIRVRAQTSSSILNVSVLSNTCSKARIAPCTLTRLKTFFNSRVLLSRLGTLAGLTELSLLGSFEYHACKSIPSQRVRSGVLVDTRSGHKKGRRDVFNSS